MKPFKHITAPLLGLAIAGFAAGGAMAANLTGAGGTAIYPVLQVWAQKYHAKTGNQVNYQAIGSGGGIAQIKARTVDFANSDKPLKRDELAASHLVQFPQVVISIVPVVHLPGIKAGQLVLNGQVLSKIFLGQITRWNDPRIGALNPGVKLPTHAVAVAHRSDGSGTSYIFTHYLSTVSPEWKQKAGAGKSVNWPVGLGGKGSEGVTGLIKQTPGSIGYVELNYAVENKLPVAALQNKAGKFIMPSVESTTAAAAGAVAAMKSDIRPPCSNRESTSRPRSSVPSQWAPEGASGWPLALRPSASCSVGL